MSYLNHKRTTTIFYVTLKFAVKNSRRFSIARISTQILSLFPSVRFLKSSNSFRVSHGHLSQCDTCRRSSNSATLWKKNCVKKMTKLFLPSSKSKKQKVVWHTLSLSLSQYFSLSLTHIHTRTFSLSLAHSLSPYHTPTHAHMVLTRIFQTRFEWEVLQLKHRKMGQLNTFSEDEMCANHFDAKAFELCLNLE